MATCAEAPPPLILASTSRYRAALLARTGLPFTQFAPGVDEAARPGEAPRARARRLAREKALAVAARPGLAAGTLVIGSDQVAVCAGVVLDKPGTLENAAAQLRRASGNSVAFFTAVALARVEAGGDGDGDDDDGGPQPRSRLVGVRLDTTRVRFRHLPRDTIRRYLAAEPALDCAGSFKSEGLGVALMAGLETRDPAALVGLPLIDTLALLRRAGVRCP